MSRKYRLKEKWQTFKEKSKRTFSQSNSNEKNSENMNVRFEEHYERKGDFSETLSDGTRKVQKYRLLYRYTNKMKEPQIKITGNPDESIVNKFIEEVNQKYKRDFYLDYKKDVKYLGE